MSKLSFLVKKVTSPKSCPCKPKIYPKMYYNPIFMSKPGSNGAKIVKLDPNFGPKLTKSSKGLCKLASTENVLKPYFLQVPTWMTIPGDNPSVRLLANSICITLWDTTFWCGEEGRVHSLLSPLIYFRKWRKTVWKKCQKKFLNTEIVYNI